MEPDEIEALSNVLDDPPAPPEAEAETEQVYDPSQQYFDEGGNEMRPNEETGVWEVVATAEPEPPVAEVPAVEAKPAYTPPVPTYNVPGLTPERQAEIDEIAITQGYVAAQMALAPYLQAQQMQSQAVANYHLDQAQAKNPEFYAIHRRSIEAVLSQMPPEQRATKQAVDDASLYAIRQDVLQTGNFEEAILRAADLIRKQKPNGTPPASPPRVLPPSQRATAPTVSPNRAAVTQTRDSYDMQEYLKIPGMTRDEAQKIINREKGRR